MSGLYEFYYQRFLVLTTKDGYEFYYQRFLVLTTKDGDMRLVPFVSVFLRNRHRLLSMRFFFTLSHETSIIPDFGIRLKKMALIKKNKGCCRKRNSLL